MENTGASRCQKCNKLVATYDYRLGYHWPVPGGTRTVGVPGVAEPFGCEGGGEVDAAGLAAHESFLAAQREREAALAAFRAGDPEPLWRLDPWEAHVREGGD